jgi:hypothetical protein
MRSRLLAVLAMLAVAAALSAFGAHRAMAAPVLVVTATPASGLVDGQPVRVDGDGFAASSHFEIFECAGDSVDEQRCDPRNAFEVDSDPAGHVRFAFPVDARIYLGPAGKTSYDCRSEAAGCRVGVGLMLEHANSAFATLGFQANAPLLAPVSATAAPSTGLADGQTITVHGEHLSAFEGAWVLQCRTGGAPRACDLDRGVQRKPAADGTLTTGLTVRAAFRSPLGDDVNCTAPGACSVVVSWGFADVPDRFASVPLTFAAPPPPSPPPTTTTNPPATVTELPRTGTSSGASSGLALLGALLTAVGAFGVVMGRRRRAAA